jgi:hypothetical protein
MAMEAAAAAAAEAGAVADRAATKKTTTTTMMIPRKQLFLFFFFLFFFLFVSCFAELAAVEAKTAPVAMFVFGDSLVDTGNNDFIPSTARANFRPNGLDYPTRRPTGRFCNGKIISDFISTPSACSLIFAIAIAIALHCCFVRVLTQSMPFASNLP